MEAQTACIKDITQFELSKLVLKNLNKWKLSPTSKLVLLTLTSYYPNIFPSQQTIADELGISKRSVERAFVELRKAIIILTEENKKTNTLNCRFTNIFFEQLKLSAPPRQNCGLPTDKLTNKQTNEQNSYKKGSFKKYHSNVNREGMHYPKWDSSIFGKEKKTAVTPLPCVEDMYLKLKASNPSATRSILNVKSKMNTNT